MAGISFGEDNSPVDIINLSVNMACSVEAGPLQWLVDACMVMKIPSINSQRLIYRWRTRQTHED